MVLDLNSRISSHASIKKSPLITLQWSDSVNGCLIKIFICIICSSAPKSAQKLPQQLTKIANDSSYTPAQNATDHKRKIY